jgi:hypothetical protein
MAFVLSRHLESLTPERHLGLLVSTPTLLTSLTRRNGETGRAEDIPDGSPAAGWLRRPEDPAEGGDHPDGCRDDDGEREQEGGFDGGRPPGHGAGATRPDAGTRALVVGGQTIASS